jgi:hypothetical protein
MIMGWNPEQASFYKIVVDACDETDVGYVFDYNIPNDYF